MAKRKNKDAAKRREAKRREKAITRKAKSRASTQRNIQPEYFVESVPVRKISEVVIDYAEPLLNLAEEGEAKKRAIAIAILLWNISFLPEQEALEEFEIRLGDIMGDDPEAKQDLRGIFESMYFRKSTLFANDRRYILDYSLKKGHGGYHLTVSSALMKN